MSIFIYIILLSFSHLGLGHFKDESNIKQVKGGIENVFITDIASSVDCCIALTGETWFVFPVEGIDL